MYVPIHMYMTAAYQYIEISHHFFFINAALTGYLESKKTRRSIASVDDLLDNRVARCKFSSWGTPSNL